MAAELSSSSKAEKLSTFSDDVGCTEGEGKVTGAQPELVTNEVVSITPDMEKCNGNVDFSEAHGEATCIAAEMGSGVGFC
jgi:hypothetical protein